MNATQKPILPGRANVKQRISISLSVAMVALALGAQAAPMGLLVPAYFYPGPLWAAMNSAASQVPLVAIMNPNNGPDTSLNSDYAAAVASLGSAGGRTIGYVFTSYGTRDINAVKTDIDRYFSFYPISGIFLDEMANDASVTHQDYYAAIYQYIQGKGTKLLVAANPGINTQEAYLTRPGANVLVTFESDAGYPAYVPDGWTTNHLARHFCHLTYSTPDAATMTNYLNLAAARNVGWVYLTDDGGLNPWDTLPSYWTNEVECVRLLNQSAAASRLAPATSAGSAPAVQIFGAPGTYEIRAPQTCRTGRPTYSSIQRATRPQWCFPILPVPQPAFIALGNRQIQ